MFSSLFAIKAKDYFFHLYKGYNAKSYDNRKKLTQLTFVESQEWIVESHCDGCGPVCFLEIIIY